MEYAAQEFGSLEIERRSELRWLLSWEMTRMNLDMQIQATGCEHEIQLTRARRRRLARYVAAEGEAFS
jgi:hypothetical protein